MCVCVCACERERERCCLLQAEDGIRDSSVTGVQTCALPIYMSECVCVCDCFIPLWTSVCVCVCVKHHIKLCPSGAHAFLHKRTRTVGCDPLSVCVCVCERVRER